MGLVFVCHICSNPHVVPHHVKSVGAGGVDYENLVPFCIKHHVECEKKGRKTFEKKYELNLKELAIFYASQSGTGEGS